MTRDEMLVVREALARVEDWVKVETEVIVTGKRPLVPGSKPGRPNIVAEALQRRDEMYAVTRALRPLVEVDAASSK